MMTLLENFWQLTVQSAPWLLIGYFLAGVINTYLPEAWLKNQLGKTTFGHSVKAALIGAPLPLCSCGVIPTALGLRKRGASKNATAAFMVATPETGVDSVSVTYALLGPVMAIFRPFAAISSAIIAGELVRFIGEPETPKAEAKTHGCCHSAKSGCDSNAKHSDIKSLLDFSFRKLLGDTANWLLLGLAFAAIIQTYVPQEALSYWGGSFLTMLVMVLVSIPMYICATASTPIAAGLLLAGVSPGAVLVFMLTGPATNIATLGVLGKELGKKCLAAYLAGVVLTAIGMGLLLDWLIAYYGWESSISPVGHEHQEQWYYQLSGITLMLLMLRHYLSHIKPAPAPSS